MLEFLGEGVGEPSLHKEDSPNPPRLEANQRQCSSAGLCANALEEA